jgi:hypothetical protein
LSNLRIWEALQGEPQLSYIVAPVSRLEFPLDVDSDPETSLFPDVDYDWHQSRRAYNLYSPNTPSFFPLP